MSKARKFDIHYFLLFPFAFFGFFFNIVGFPEFIMDEGVYINFALNGSATEWHPPIAWLFMGAYFKLLNFPPQTILSSNIAIWNLYFIPRLFIAILSSAGIFLTYFTAKRLFNENSAVIAAAILSLSLYTSRYLRIFYLDTVVAFFFIVSIFFAVISFNKRARLSTVLILLSSISFVLALGSKTSAILLIPAMVYLIATKKKINAIVWILLPVLGLLALLWFKELASLNIMDYFQIPYNQLSNMVKLLSTIDLVLLIVGVPALIYAAYRKDLFQILTVASYIPFFFIGRPYEYYAIPLTSVFSMSVAKLVNDAFVTISESLPTNCFRRINRKTIHHTLIAVLVIALLVQSLSVSQQNLSAPQISAINYLVHNAPDNTIIISNIAYIWIFQESGRHLNIYSWYGFPSTENKTVYVIVDSHFFHDMSFMPTLQNLYKNSVSVAHFGNGISAVDVRAVQT